MRSSVTFDSTLGTCSSSVARGTVPGIPGVLAETTVRGRVSGQDSQGTVPDSSTRLPTATKEKSARPGRSSIRSAP